MKPKRFQKRSLGQNPSKALLSAAQMPPLQHKTQEPFDIRKSPAVKWLTDRSEILQAAFDYYKDRGAIVFDKNTGTWKGAQWNQN
jgi:hypothetical protein